MRSLVLFGLSLVVSVSASVELQINYHDSVGIPQAERIRVIETEILAKNLGHNDLLQNRIVGGQETAPHAFPYFAGLLIDLVGTNARSVCGASLLTPNRLVTAAHCWLDDTDQAFQFLVVLGSNFLYNGGERIYTKTVITHPHYDKSSNDVAVIYLPRNARIDNFRVKPINLPNESELRNQFVGYPAVATGFGKMSDKTNKLSRVLRHVNLTVISKAECASVFKRGLVTSNHICTSGSGGVGICSGDSGGPLVTFDNNRQPFLIGIIAFCAVQCDEGAPSGSSRVTSFYTFITQHLQIAQK
ncbi:hypothetical protein PYW07_003552 [Mythimna separata]|uniref:Peptidase S1 domain-containing protein n=1 Tax=Mythimna separata TaxID=271217 RepID=A0AAD7YPU5_MYTSE|nr:hypothetical protein PYW07_003552 [Mythimna separata]